MPEGPEVLRMARMLDEALRGARLLRLETRFRATQAWLAEHPGAFEDCTIRRVRAMGKNILFCCDGNRFMRSHLRMYGRWTLYPPDADVPPDRRMRAHLYTDRAQAVFTSGPRLDLGFGDPAVELEHLATLGPDILAEPFHGFEWRRRLLLPGDRETELGVALLNQRACAGIGNYLKSEILWACRLNPWLRVRQLSEEDWACLLRVTPQLGQRALRTEGWTLTDEEREAVERDPRRLLHVGRRHYVFRRTHQPCYRCGARVRQQRQGPEKGRITYWCEGCQGPAPAVDAYGRASRAARARSGRAGNAHPER